MFIIKNYKFLVFFLVLSSCSNLQKKILIEDESNLSNFDSLKFNKVMENENGSIFKTNNMVKYEYHSLFEDHKSRNIGDILTVLLQENVSASHSSSSNARRNNKIDFRISTPFDIINNKISRNNFFTDVNSNNNFIGQGESSSRNAFNGSITVSVLNIMDNGNLYVTGYKKISVNQNQELIKFSGIVNPKTIDRNNRVLSTLISNANIEYVENGSIYNYKKLNWLQKFLFYFLPF